MSRIQFAIGRLVVTAMLVSISFGAQSAFIDNGFSTTDTLTGLVWLDLTETQSFSYNQVETELVAGGLFESYRRASQAELITLFTNFGLVSGPVNATQTDFISLFGETANQSGNPESFGYADSVGALAAVYGLDFSIENGAPSYIVLTGELQQNKSINFDGFGSFLVKPVPVPAAVWLFGTALIGLAGFSKRRKAA